MNLRSELILAGYLAGSTLSVWHAVFRATKRVHIEGSLGNGLAWGLPGVTEMHQAKAWSSLWACYRVAPKTLSALLVAVSEFHSRELREWRLGDKLLYFSSVASRAETNPHPNGPRPNVNATELAQLLKVHCGTTVTPAQCRKEISLELKRRDRILLKWGHTLAEPIEAILNSHFL